MSDRPNSTGICWALRKDLEDFVMPWFEEIACEVAGHRLYMDRATARLLAKRINECLDATVKK